MLSKLPIGDVATQYFADRDMFCAGRVEEGDLKRTMKACESAASMVMDPPLVCCALYIKDNIPYSPA